MSNYSVAMSHTKYFGRLCPTRRTVNRIHVHNLHQWRVSSMYPGSAGMFSALDAADVGSLSGVDSERVRCRSQKLMVQNNLIRGGGSAGTFHLLPFTTRAIEKLYRVIDREMNSIGAQKISMPCLSAATPWKLSGRWDVMGSELIPLKDRKGIHHCMAPTHEEAVTSLVSAEGALSYRRLPIMLYQIGRKFRDEMRPKNGLLRCREFEMKDLYTFDEDEESGRRTYEKICQAYENILNRLKLSYIKVGAATGAMGGTKSHEFQLVASVGEDILYQCQECGNGFNKEVLVSGDEVCEAKCTIESATLKKVSGIEVAHAFLLGLKYSELFKARYVDQSGTQRPMFMGCFGIGVTRLIAAAIEILSATDNIRWPHLLAPHQVVIIPQKEGYQSDITWNLSQELMSSLGNMPHLNGECVIDDRLHLSIGKRLKHANQLGFPFAIIVGKKALENPALYEVVSIYDKTTDLLSKDLLHDRMKRIETIHLW